MELGINKVCLWPENKFKFKSKIGSKALNCLSVNSSISKRNQNSKHEQSCKSRISCDSMNLGSTHQVSKASGVTAQQNTKVENLAVSNQNLKFKVAELQKEKYSLSQLNKKLSNEIKRFKQRDSSIVILKKKDLEQLLRNYNSMSEELEQLQM